MKLVSKNTETKLYTIPIQVPIFSYNTGTAITTKIFFGPTYY